MNKIRIKQSPSHGEDTKTFRAYSVADKPLGVSASTTGNEAFGALRCAAKAFQKYCAVKVDLDEIETRVRLSPFAPCVWDAELQPKCPCDTLSDTSPVKCWYDVRIAMPDADATVLVYAPESTEPIWLGYFDGECWRDVSADAYEHPVTHWMDIPEPPEVQS